ncbi:tethering complex subunit, partial [Polyrhizophydium stewartii]
MSLLDHFEDPAPRALASPAAAPRSSLQLELAPDVHRRSAHTDGDAGPPKFMLDKVQFSFPDELQCVTVASNMLAVALRTFTAPKEQTRLRLLRIDLDKPDAIEDIVFVTKQRDDAIQAVFYSPLAHHLIISCYSGDNYYLHERWNKPHLLSKIRGVRITSVAWGPGESAETTGPLLLGSAQGHVFETELNPREDFFKKEERYFAQVFSLHRDAPIVGIHVEQLSRGNSRFLIAIASTSRIYQFVGDSRPSDSGFFASFFARLDGSNDFQEMPGNLGASTVRTIRTKQPDGSLVTALGWMTGTGVYIGKIATGGYTHKDATIESPQVFPYAAPDSRSQSSLVNSLVSFILSDFHFVLLLEDSIVAISTLDSQIVAWESIPLAMDERVLGMASDESRRTYWVHTNLSLYELIVTDEDRDLWKIYLDKKNYELASEYAKTPEQRGIVKEKQADHLFAQKQYAAAAGLYAETDLSFEDVCLRFVSLKEDAALAVYLRKKLSLLRRQDLTQTTLIGTWLMELLAGKLCASEQASDALAHQLKLSPELEQQIRPSLDSARQEFDSLTIQLRSLLSEYKDRLHHPTVYNLLGSHGRTAELIYFAELISDWDRLVTFFIEHHEWHKALEVISRQDSVDFYYKHSSVLIQHIPREVIGLWMKVPSLNPRFLMPSMLNLSSSGSALPASRAALIGYLEYLVSSGNRDRVIQNFLMQLYAADSTPDNETPVLAFVNSQRESPLFDVPYSLRVCLQRGLMQSAVQLYAIMGLFDEAVDLALK